MVLILIVSGWNVFHSVVGGLIVFTKVVALHAVIFPSDKLPVDLVTDIGLQEHAADDTLARGSLHFDFEHAEEDVIVRFDAWAVTLLVNSKCTCSVRAPVYRPSALYWGHPAGRDVAVPKSVLNVAAMALSGGHAGVFVSDSHCITLSVLTCYQCIAFRVSLSLGKWSQYGK
jgi:hypothetical protein